MKRPYDYGLGTGLILLAVRACVHTWATVQAVLLSAFSIQSVVAFATDEGVIAVAAAQKIIAAFAVEDVVATEAADDVVASGAFEFIFARGTFDRFWLGAQQLAKRYSLDLDLDLASRRAAITVDEVTVITLLTKARLDNAVTANLFDAEV